MQLQVPGIHYLIRLNLWLGFHGDDALFLHQQDLWVIIILQLASTRLPAAMHAQLASG